MEVEDPQYRIDICEYVNGVLGEVGEAVILHRRLHRREEKNPVTFGSFHVVIGNAANSRDEVRQHRRDHCAPTASHLRKGIPRPIMIWPRR